MIAARPQAVLMVATGAAAASFIEPAHEGLRRHTREIGKARRACELRHDGRLHRSQGDHRGGPPDGRTRQPRRLRPSARLDRDTLDLGGYSIGFRPNIRSGSRFVEMSIVTVGKIRQ
ncbi:hypothetical protein LP415_07635 [Polaromonas sp. P1(28)-8]|nr:hypothetical protein LP415_07635 [Polaromonas sp. P1(28)-8]